MICNGSHIINVEREIGQVDHVDVESVCTLD